MRMFDSSFRTRKFVQLMKLVALIALVVCAIAGCASEAQTPIVEIAPTDTLDSEEGQGLQSNTEDDSPFGILTSEVPLEDSSDLLASVADYSKLRWLDRSRITIKPAPPKMDDKCTGTQGFFFFDPDVCIDNLWVAKSTPGAESPKTSYAYRSSFSAGEKYVYFIVNFHNKSNSPKQVAVEVWVRYPGELGRWTGLDHLITFPPGKYILSLGPYSLHPDMEAGDYALNAWVAVPEPCAAKCNAEASRKFSIRPGN